MNKKEITIGLFGINGLYNFGCEAIVRGAYLFSKNIYPNSKVVYYSFNYEYDKKVLQNLDINVFEVKKKNGLIVRAFNKIFRLLKINYGFLTFDKNEIINNTDVFLSIGGDIYTIPYFERNKKKYIYYNQIVNFFNKAIKKHKKIILFGASVGPWGSNKKAVDYYLSSLRNYELILCRENKTYEYLNEYKLSNILLFPDPAFLIRNDKIASKEKYIGINMSPLSFVEKYGNYDFATKKLADLFDLIFDKFGFKILLIPHVLSNDSKDNDLLFMKKIYSNMKNKEYVEFANSENGFIGLKKELSFCYVVIAARMHCAINAIVENVPSIFISYSSKSEGMCEYIYDNLDMKIDLFNIEERLIDKIDFVLKNRESIINKIFIKNNEIYNSYKEKCCYIKEYKLKNE